MDHLTKHSAITVLEQGAPDLAQKRNRKIALLPKTGDSHELALAKVVGARLLDQFGLDKSERAYLHAMDLAELEPCDQDGDEVKKAKDACRRQVLQQGIQGSRDLIAALKTLRERHPAVFSSPAVRVVDPQLIKHFDNLGLSEAVRRTAIVLFDLKLDPLTLRTVRKLELERIKRWLTDSIPTRARRQNSTGFTSNPIAIHSSLASKD